MNFGWLTIPLRLYCNAFTRYTDWILSSPIKSTAVCDNFRMARADNYNCDIVVLMSTWPVLSNLQNWRTSATRISVLVITSLFRLAKRALCLCLACSTLVLNSSETSPAYYRTTSQNLRVALRSGCRFYRAWARKFVSGGASRQCLITHPQHNKNTPHIWKIWGVRHDYLSFFCAFIPINQRATRFTVFLLFTGDFPHRLR